VWFKVCLCTIEKRERHTYRGIMGERERERGEGLNRVKERESEKDRETESE